jgi:hypothetical protein
MTIVIKKSPVSIDTGLFFEPLNQLTKLQILLLLLQEPYVAISSEFLISK